MPKILAEFSNTHLTSTTIMISNVKCKVNRLALVTGALFFGGYCHAQKLTVALNLGKVVPVNAFSFYDETKGVNGFTATNSQGGSVALGFDVEYTLNKRFTMGIAPQLIYNHSKMEIKASDSIGTFSISTVRHVFQTTVIPYCIGYKLELFKKKLPLKIVGGLSYNRYGLSGTSASVQSGGSSSTGTSSSTLFDNSSFTRVSTMGFIAGVETYPMKGFSRFGFYIRYYGSFSSGAFNTKAPKDGFQASFSDGTTTRVFNQGFGYRPSNLVIGIAYKFNIVK